MVFAVDEINRDPFLLPGLRLGYRILDSCGMHPWCLRGALSLVAGRSPQCELSSPLPGAAGKPAGTELIGIACRQSVDVLYNERVENPFFLKTCQVIVEIKELLIIIEDIQIVFEVCH